MRISQFGFHILVCVASFSSSAFAGVSEQSLIGAGMDPNCAKHGENVSKSEGNWKSVNSYGCLGAFQFCPGTFEQYYSGTVDQFLNDPSAQVAAWTQYEKDEWAKAQQNGFDSYIGQQICGSSGNCGTVDASGILFACQFGCGPKGKLANYLKNGGTCVAGKPSSTNDANGVCAGDYLLRGTGNDVSCFTGPQANCFTSPTMASITPQGLPNLNGGTNVGNAVL